MEVTTLDGATEQYTYLEHSKLPAAEIRRGINKEKAPAPEDAVYRKALFQSNVTVIQKLAGDRTVETIKIVDPNFASVHHLLTARMTDKKMGKNVLISTGSEHYLLIFKGSKLIITGNVFVHKLASADATPDAMYEGHVKQIKMSPEAVHVYDMPKKDALVAGNFDHTKCHGALVATAKFMQSEAGFTAEMLSGDSVGLNLAMLVGAHLLVQTQFYYRPAEKRALGSNGSIGMLMLQGAAFHSNDMVRGGASNRLKFGHDATAFHGCTKWADGSGTGAYAQTFDSKAGFIDQRRNVTCVVHKRADEDPGLACATTRHGVKITDVAAGSAFSEAGLVAKDYILSVNGEPITKLEHAAKLMAEAKGAMTIVVQRGAQPTVAEQVLRALI